MRRVGRYPTEVKPEISKIDLVAVLLRYARLVGVSTDVLIDDDLVVPNKIPGPARKQRFSE